MKRKFFTVLTVLCMIISRVYASPFDLFFSKKTLNAFSQKPEESIYCDTVGHWCNYAAERLFNEDIFQGIKIGKNYYFMPDEYITRGEFLLYLNAVLNIPTQNSSALPFNDASSIPKWQYPTVYTMYTMGYINGNREKNGLFFNHDEKISRLECALVLNNMLSINNSSEKTEYYDSYLIPKYALNAVKNVTDYGLMQGYEDKSFRPYVKVTRGMLADILCHAKDLQIDKTP